MNKKRLAIWCRTLKVQLTEFFRLNVGRKFHLLQSFLYFMPVQAVFSHNFRMDCPRDKFSRFYFSVVIDFLYKKRQSWNPPLTAIFVVCDFEQQLRTSLQKNKRKIESKVLLNTPQSESTHRYMIETYHTILTHY